MNKNIQQEGRDEIIKLFNSTIISYQKKLVRDSNPFIPNEKTKYLINKLNTLSKRFNENIPKRL